MPTKKQMNAKVASVLIKMAEDPQLQKDFADDPNKFAEQQGLFGQDIQVMINLGRRNVSISLAANASDPFDQNQQMYVFEKKIK